MRHITRATVLAGALAASSAVLATEGGGSIKPPGLDTILSGVMLPPGLFLTSTTSAYNADRLLDGSGRDRAGISNVDVRARVLSARVTYVWPGVQVWGADVETRAGALFGDVKLARDVETPGGRVRQEASSSGQGDMFVAPVLLGWHSERFHQIAGAMLFIPTGKFDAANPASIGRGYYAASPGYFFTWLPSAPVEVSGSLFYLVNAENRDTRYRSGNEATFDYSLGYNFRPGWQLGANGYLYRQVTDDKKAGAVVGDDGTRGQAMAFGPFVRVYGRGWGVSLRWLRESGVENRAKGDRFYVAMGIKL